MQLTLCKIALPPRVGEREGEERGGPVVARVPSLLWGARYLHNALLHATGIGGADGGGDPGRPTAAGRLAPVVTAGAAEVRDARGPLPPLARWASLRRERPGLASLGLFSRTAAPRRPSRNSLRPPRRPPPPADCPRRPDPAAKGPGGIRRHHRASLGPCFAPDSGACPRLGIPLPSVAAGSGVANGYVRTLAVSEAERGVEYVRRNALKRVALEVFERPEAPTCRNFNGACRSFVVPVSFLAQETSVKLRQAPTKLR